MPETFDQKSKRIWDQIALELLAQQDPGRMVSLWRELEEVTAAERRAQIYRRPQQVRQDQPVVP
jgi:hypothetical protein